MTPKPSSLVNRIVAYINQYVTFTNPDYPFVAALWAIGTYLHLSFDAFAYLVVTSATKRSGKTRFLEVLMNVVSNPRSFAGASAAAIFRSIRDEHPTIAQDEAEENAGASAGRRGADIFSVTMNSGYRQGQVVPRIGKGGNVEEWPTYCPKIFALIGDVYDTLRDRSIVIRMQRGEAAMRFQYEHAKAEGNALGEEVQELVKDQQRAIVDGYQRHAGLPFLGDRDEEIWLPLFAVCQAVAPDRVRELTRIAADMAVEKTAEAVRYVNLLGAEKDAEDDEYSRRLLRDLLAVMDGKQHIYTADALTALHALDTGPWRKFRGTGLTPMNLADLLARFAVVPRYIKTFGKKGKGATKTAKVARGYRRAEVADALRKL